jgi:hypothetical protein
MLTKNVFKRSLAAAFARGYSGLEAIAQVRKCLINLLPDKTEEIDRLSAPYELVELNKILRLKT